MRLFASPRLTAMLQRFRPPEGEPISAKVLNKSIETAQKRIESRNYNIRKYTLEYDDVINKQRKEIYSFRNDLLFSENPINIAKEILKDTSFSISEKYKNSQNILGYKEELMTHFPITFSFSETSQNLLEEVSTTIINSFEEKLNYQTQIIKNLNEDAENILKEAIRNILILKLDELWQKHLLAIDHLRSDVQLRSIGQKDPLMEFKHESFRLFDFFSQNVKLEMSKNLFLFEMAPKQRDMQDILSSLEMHQSQNIEQNDEKKNLSSIKQKIGRNILCPCGSGKKYKRCCYSKNA
jgi:preprotein translocase subunit SecA